MAHETGEPKKSLVLPVAAARPSDVVRLVRELDLIDEALLQTGLKSGVEAKLPKVSRLMEQLAESSKLDLTDAKDRATLKQFLEGTQKHAPVFHISFSADPPPAFIEKLVTWLRREIHPSLLLTVGLQPNIGAGCILRTVNKQFDMSLKQDFASKRELLLKQISRPASRIAPAVPAVAAVPVVPPVVPSAAPAPPPAPTAPPAGNEEAA
ncbi:MAG: hypothetical protein ACREJM_06695 [Candidatus Saccharimonadales bacterium]